MNLVKAVGGIFLLVGLMMLAATSYLYIDQNDFIADAKEAEGQIIDLVRKQQNKDGNTSYTYSALVRFTDDEAVTHEFIDRVGSNPPRYSKGQDVILLYAPDNPTDAIINDFWGRWAMVIIFGCLGTIFSSIGGGMYFWQVHKARTRLWLLKNGTAFSVDFLEVQRDLGQSMNGRNPYRVLAQGKNPFTGKLEQYLSKAVWIDPTEYLPDRKLRVLVDPNNSSRHMLDVEWLADEI